MSDVDIIRLEHSSGLRPIGEYPDHCPTCRRVHDCEHTDLVNITAWDGTILQTTCEWCGLSMGDA